MVQPQRLIRKINRVLGPHLVQDSLLKYCPKQAHPSWGCCYPAAEALYHLWGRDHGFIPHYISYEVLPGIITTHWFLANGGNGICPVVYDPTGFQFDNDDVGLGRKIDYTLGKRCGFLTKQPSKRAKQIMEQMIGKA